MKLGRQHALTGFVALALIAFGIWIALNTEWVEVRVPDPRRQSAPHDADFQLKQLATRLGAQVSTPTNLDQLPPIGATLALSSSDWNLFPERAALLRRWVEDGGHLWLPYQGELDEALKWIPVRWISLKRATPPTTDADADDGDDDEVSRPAPPPRPKPGAKPEAPRCAGVDEPAGIAPAFGSARHFDSCLYANERLETTAPPQWALDGPSGRLVARVAVGRGSVTVASTYLPWNNLQLLQRDHALLAAATLRLHAGQTIWFVQDEARAPLLSFLWQRGMPAVLIGGLALGFGLWRGAVRFGPRTAPLPTARRSMAEQIRGTAEFVHHHGGAALLAAQQRALHDAARGRLNGYDAHSRSERARAIANATGLDAAGLVRAMTPDPDDALARHHGAALTLLETARRRLLNTPTNRPR